MPESGADRLLRLVAERNRDQAQQRRPPLAPDQVYVDAVWDSALTSTQKITALCYGNHARNSPNRDRAWVLYQRLMPQTGIRSRETIAKMHAELTAAGWLEPAGHRPGHKQVTVYLLTLPPDQYGNPDRTSTESGTGADIRTGTESGTETSTDIRSDQYGNPDRTSTESGTRLSEDSLKDSLKDSLLAPPTPAKPTRGTRIPDDFKVTGPMRAWATNHAAGVDSVFETAQFRDHWRAAAGAKAVKVDWVAAWQTWMRNANRWKAERTSNGRSTPNARPSEPDRVADIRERGARLQALEDQKAIGS